MSEIFYNRQLTTFAGLENQVVSDEQNSRVLAFSMYPVSIVPIQIAQTKRSTKHELIVKCLGDLCREVISLNIPDKFACTQSVERLRRA